MNMRIPSKCNSRADICRIVEIIFLSFLNAAMFIFGNNYITRLTHVININFYVFFFFSEEFIAFGYGELVWGHYRATHYCFII